MRIDNIIRGFPCENYYYLSIIVIVHHSLIDVDFSKTENKVRLSQIEMFEL